MLCDHHQRGACRQCESFLADLVASEVPPQSEVRVRREVRVEVDQDVHTRLTVPRMRAVRVG